MPPRRRDRRQGFEDEGANGDAWMRQDEPRTGGLADEPVVIEEIEIESARPPPDGASPPGSSLDGMQPPKQGIRRKVRLYECNAIEVARLVDATQRCGDQK